MCLERAWGLGHSSSRRSIRTRGLDVGLAAFAVYHFWLVSPLEVFIFFVGVIVTVFSTIENGIYCTVCLSAAMLLYRILRSKGRFLGRVRVASMLGDHVVGGDTQRGAEYGTFTGTPEAPFRNVFLPITHADGSNPEVELDNPYPGIFIYRFSEGFNYTNASHSLSYMTDYIFAHTRRTNLASFERPGDRPWNNPALHCRPPFHLCCVPFNEIHPHFSS